MPRPISIVAIGIALLAAAGTLASSQARAQDWGYYDNPPLCQPFMDYLFNPQGRKTYTQPLEPYCARQRCVRRGWCASARSMTGGWFTPLTAIYQITYFGCLEVTCARYLRPLRGDITSPR
jgi:hypothetical protein